MGVAVMESEDLIIPCCAMDRVTVGPGWDYGDIETLL